MTRNELADNIINEIVKDIESQPDSLNDFWKALNPSYAQSIKATWKKIIMKKVDSYEAMNAK